MEKTFKLWQRNYSNVCCLKQQNITTHLALDNSENADWRTMPKKNVACSHLYIVAYNTACDHMFCRRCRWWRRLERFL